MVSLMLGSCHHRDLSTSICRTSHRLFWGEMPTFVSRVWIVHAYLQVCVKTSACVRICVTSSLNTSHSGVITVTVQCDDRLHYGPGAMTQAVMSNLYFLMRNREGPDLSVEHSKTFTYEPGIEQFTMYWICCQSTCPSVFNNQPGQYLSNFFWGSPSQMCYLLYVTGHVTLSQCHNAILWYNINIWRPLFWSLQIKIYTGAWPLTMDDYFRFGGCLGFLWSCINQSWSKIKETH